MKRIFISISCGAALFFGYYFFIFIFFQIYRLEVKTLLTLVKPISFPAEIYRSIFGSYPVGDNAVIILNVTGSILLYSVPFYLILTLYSKLKTQSKVEKIMNPPKPPVFEIEE